MCRSVKSRNETLVKYKFLSYDPLIIVLIIMITILTIIIMIVIFGIFEQPSDLNPVCFICLGSVS